jgi:hypothetical protein
LNQESNIVIQFYQNLGKLFFAFAAIDNSVRPEELNKLINIVTKKWMPLKNFDENSKNAIINTFRWLQKDNEYNAETCFRSFIDYMHSHKLLFNKNINTLILKTASEITSSFSGQNKSEVILLAKLDIELKNL